MKPAPGAKKQGVLWRQAAGPASAGRPWQCFFTICSCMEERISLCWGGHGRRASSPGEKDPPETALAESRPVENPPGRAQRAFSGWGTAHRTATRKHRLKWKITSPPAVRG